MRNWEDDTLENLISMIPYTIFAVLPNTWISPARSLYVYMSKQSLD